MPSIPLGGKVANCSSIEIYNYVPFKANGNFIIMCDAPLFRKERQNCLWYGNALYHFIVFAGAIVGCRYSYTKEVEMLEKSENAGDIYSTKES